MHRETPSLTHTVQAFFPGFLFFFFWQFSSRCSRRKIRDGSLARFLVGWLAGGACRLSGRRGWLVVPAGDASHLIAYCTVKTIPVNRSIELPYALVPERYH